jgi:DNA topoisomerase IB
VSVTSQPATPLARDHWRNAHRLRAVERQRSCMPSHTVSSRARHRRRTDLPADPRESARAAGLRYSTDARPGITRRRAGRGFGYRDPDGKRVTDRTVLARIRSLAIPPAWTDVWICNDPSGHLQATGRDARGRKQYRYHAAWRRGRDDAKFERLLDVARVLRGSASGARPTSRRRAVAREGPRRGRPAARADLIRVGNEEYARLNRSFGLTTLKRGMRRSRVGDPVPVRGQVRPAPRGRLSRSAPGVDRQPLPGPARPGPVRV